MTCALFVDHPPSVWGHLHFPGHLPAWSVAPLIGVPRLLNVHNRPLTGNEPIGAWADQHGVVWVTTRGNIGELNQARPPDASRGHRGGRGKRKGASTSGADHSHAASTGTAR